MSSNLLVSFVVQRTDTVSIIQLSSIIINYQGINETLFSVSFPGLVYRLLCCCCSQTEPFCKAIHFSWVCMYGKRHLKNKTIESCSIDKKIIKINGRIFNNGALLALLQTFLCSHYAIIAVYGFCNCSKLKWS